MRRGDRNHTFLRYRLPVPIVRYHCGGWSEEVNSCILISYIHSQLSSVHSQLSSVHSQLSSVHSQLSSGADLPHLTFPGSLQPPSTPHLTPPWGGHCVQGWYGGGEQRHQWEPAQQQADRSATCSRREYAKYVLYHRPPPRVIPGVCGEWCLGACALWGA